MRRALLLGCAVMMYLPGVSRAQVTGEVPKNISGVSLPGGMIGGVAFGSGATGFFLIAVKNQPYSLVEKKTHVFRDPDGTTVTRSFEQRRMRDAQGRERTEDRALKDGTFELVAVHIDDPDAQTYTTLFISEKSAHVQHFAQPKPLTTQEVATAAKLKAQTEAILKDRPDIVMPKVEDLPGRSIAGVYAYGKRQAMLIPAGSWGNVHEIRVVQETWTSQELKIQLLRTDDDPRSGTSRIEVTELSRSDPAPELFQIPADFKVTETGPEQ